MCLDLEHVILTPAESVETLRSRRAFEVLITSLPMTGGWFVLIQVGSAKEVGRADVSLPAGSEVVSEDDEREGVHCDHSF